MRRDWLAATAFQITMSSVNPDRRVVRELLGVHLLGRGDDRLGVLELARHPIRLRKPEPVDLRQCLRVQAVVGRVL
eukprot:8465942-Pyramimonas_sp.AAC.1